MSLRQLKLCVCGRPPEDHQYDIDLGALMGTRDMKCDGYDPQDFVNEELNFTEF